MGKSKTKATNDTQIGTNHDGPKSIGSAGSNVCLQQQQKQQQQLKSQSTTEDTNSILIDYAKFEPKQFQSIMFREHISEQLWQYHIDPIEVMCDKPNMYIVTVKSKLSPGEQYYFSGERALVFKRDLAITAEKLQQLQQHQIVELQAPQPFKLANCDILSKSCSSDGSFQDNMRMAMISAMSNSRQDGYYGAKAMMQLFPDLNGTGNDTGSADENELGRELQTLVHDMATMKRSPGQILQKMEAMRTKYEHIPGMDRAGRGPNMFLEQLIPQFK
ncbi:hypothetical protein GQ42DRAFT_168347 [Ramicandelaber brevisporus]|nr:hypothetical protein GQ42DRAFT_168347 [Ramicandelaber brevisporus]